ncbi:hypothetical protein AB0P36_35100 [Streptomyces flavidovirens]|uniref:hypothetical protein n=1 Tax=Streptomyces flavidovirens TaxID=67298 RepID=UPI0034432286
MTSRRRTNYWIAVMPSSSPSKFFAELQAEDKPASTVRSYGVDLLRWWRFLWAFDIEWSRATRTDARDFTRWMQIANKPQRLHWRHRKAGYTAETAPKTVRKKTPGTPNAITGSLAWPAVRREDACRLRNGYL